MSLSHGFLLFCLCVSLFQLHFTFSASGLTLRAFVDDSPGSPLYRFQNLTTEERIERLIKITNARAMYWKLVSSPNASAVFPDNIPAPVFRDRYYYAVQFALGSQGHIVKLLMDTGGGLTWTQCEPCRTCFEQHLPIFDPRASSTYARLPCDHRLCDEDSGFTCVRGECRYKVRYGGGPSTRGVASLETAHFSFDGSHVESYRIAFGCSRNSRNIFFEDTDISGVFGMDLSPESITQQLTTTTHSRFSYCLPRFDDAMTRQLVLSFGEDVPRLPPNVPTTLFLQPPNSCYYNLQLLDISVEDHRLGFDPSIFQVTPAGTGGFIIDSGALYSQIDGDTIGVNAFERVMQVFDAYYGSRGLRKRPGGSFENCYDLPPGYDDSASITFHFNGADFTVDGDYTSASFNGGEYFCVTILRGSYGSILGAFQQQNKRIVYDGIFGELKFIDENCIDE